MSVGYSLGRHLLSLVRSSLKAPWMRMPTWIFIKNTSFLLIKTCSSCKMERLPISQWKADNCSTSILQEGGLDNEARLSGLRSHATCPHVIFSYGGWGETMCIKGTREVCSSWSSSSERKWASSPQRFAAECAKLFQEGCKSVWTMKEDNVNI